MIFDLSTAFAAVFSFLVIFAAITDVRKLKIPNWVTLALIGLFAVHVAIGPEPLPVPQHMGVATLVLVGGFVLFAFGFMGAGDVKLLAAAALWAGPSKVLALLACMAIAGGVLGAIMLVGRTYLLWDNGHFALEWVARRFPLWVIRGEVPYGMAICAGALMSVPPLLL